MFLSHDKLERWIDSLVDVPTYRSTSSTSRLNPFQLSLSLSGIASHCNNVPFDHVVPFAMPVHEVELVMSVGIELSKAASRRS